MRYIFVLVAFFVVGCPLDDPSTGPVDECVNVAEQCRMEQGQLGVCSMTMDDELICMPQH